MASELSDIPHNMRRLYRRFERWRSAHTGRLPIPERLWTAAAELAREHGVFSTAKAVLRQNAIMIHSLQKQPPKDRSLGPSLRASVFGSGCPGLVKPLSGQTPALREERCSLLGKETAGPCCNRLRSAPFVAMVQTTHLRDLHDLSRLRPLHDPSGRSVLG